MDPMFSERPGASMEPSMWPKVLGLSNRSTRATRAHPDQYLPWDLYLQVGRPSKIKKARENDHSACFVDACPGEVWHLSDAAVLFPFLGPAHGKAS